MAKRMNDETLKIINELIDWIEELEAKINELENAPKTEIHNHYHSPTPVPMPSIPSPYTPVPMPTFPWQSPISMGGGTVTTGDGQYYTINYANTNLPKPDDDGREGIAVH